MSTVPVMQDGMRVRDSRRLLVARAAVVLGRVFRGLGRGWARWRRQAGSNRRASHGGGLVPVVGAVMGRALGARGARNRMLAVEERLALGPKQHLYVIRCGEQRLLVGSAGEAALQWMTLPEVDQEDCRGDGREQETDACENTLCVEGKAPTSPKRRRERAGTKLRTESKAEPGGPRRSGKGKTAQAGAEAAR